MLQQYQLPQQPPPDQPTGQLLNTSPAPQMPADKNVASLSGAQMPANVAVSNLGFANTMLHQLLEHKAKKAGVGKKTNQEQPPEKVATKEEAKPTEAPKQDTSNIETSISGLQNVHEKEIALLKADMEKNGMKKEYEAKIKEMEAKHQKNIDDIKGHVKSIMNG